MINFILSSSSIITSFSHGSICWKNGVPQSNRRTIMDDLFIRNYIEDLLKNIRTQVLLKLIKPYTRIRIPFISKVAIYFMLLVVALYFMLLVFVLLFWARVFPYVSLELVLKQV